MAPASNSSSCGIFSDRDRFDGSLSWLIKKHNCARRAAESQEEEELYWRPLKARKPDWRKEVQSAHLGVPINLPMSKQVGISRNSSHHGLTVSRKVRSWEGNDRGKRWKLIVWPSFTLLTVTIWHRPSWFVWIRDVSFVIWRNNSWKTSN